MNPSQNLGKSTEMLIASMLLAENRETYLPCVDDHGVDMIVRTNNYIKGDGRKAENYEFQEIQVKSINTGGLFAGMKIDPRPNYWFVFYIKDIDQIWLINSMDLVNYQAINAGKNPGDPEYLYASQNKNGKEIGKWSLDLKPTKKTPIKSSFYNITDFSRLP